MVEVITNLGKTNCEIVFELIKSLNCGNSADYESRIGIATRQYRAMVAAGIVKENEKLMMGVGITLNA